MTKVFNHEYADKETLTRKQIQQIFEQIGVVILHKNSVELYGLKVTKERKQLPGASHKSWCTIEEYIEIPDVNKLTFGQQRALAKNFLNAIPNHDEHSH